MENKLNPPRGDAGQAALEYLMTYSWALVVIIIALAALFAFGIFAPTAMAPCTGMSKLLYQDHGVSGTPAELTLAVANGTGGEMTNISAACTDFDATCTVPAENIVNLDTNQATTTIVSGGKLKVTTSGANIGETYNNKIVITYTSEEEIQHSETAACTGST